jgi:hypothetical protein
LGAVQIALCHGTGTRVDRWRPHARTQEPMFPLLGTRENQKKMVVYASGHLVPPTEFIKEPLAWFDAYLGFTD